MKVRQLSNPLKIGKGLFSILALFMMLLTPERAWAEDYNIVVNGNRVTSSNASDVLNDGTVSYDSENKTLTLSGAAINSIRIWQEYTVIDIHGENSITASDSSAIQSWVQTYSPNVVFKSTGSTLGKLTLTPASTFKAWNGLNVSYGDFSGVRFFGLGQDSNQPTVDGVVVVRKVPDAVIVVPNGIVFTDENVSVRPSVDNDEFDLYYLTKSMQNQQQGFQQYTAPFKLTTADTNNGNPSVYAYAVLKGYEDNNSTHGDESKRALIVLDRPTFSVESGTYTSEQSVVINGLPELGTTQGYLEGEVESQMFPQVRYYFDGDEENTFQYTSESTIYIDQPCTLNAYLLAVNDSNVVVRSSVFSATYTVPLAAPHPFLKPEDNTLGFEFYGDEVHYAIDYVSGDLKDVEEGTWTTDGEAITILGPCTVTAYSVKGSVTSETATAKYFGFEQSELNPVYGTEEVALPAIVPAPGNDVEVSYEGNVEAGKINLSDATIGKDFTTVIAFFSTDLDVMPFTILNDNAKLTVNVVPPAPTIVFDETKDYLNTDVVSITLPEILAEDQNARIMYSWVEDCADGNGTNYTDTSKVTLTAGTGTLYAWVRYNSGTSADDAVYSERVSQMFTVKSDIGKAYIPEFTTTATYTGEAIVPAFTVYPSSKTWGQDNPVSADNYTVSYQKDGDTQVENVDEIVDAGTYVITITGSSDTWGGSKTVTREFTISPANLSDVTIEPIADQSYTGSTIEPEVTVKLGEVTIDNNQYNLSYSNNTNVGEATVTVTFTSGNFTTSGAALVKTATFNIVNRTLAANDVTFHNNWTTYYNSDEALNLPEGIGAYIATNVGTSTVTVTQISYIPKGEAVLLNNATTTTTDNTSVEGNLLRHADNAVNADTFEGLIYGLYNGKMMRVSGTIPAGKNYLVAWEAAAPELNFVFDFEGNTAGVSQIENGEWRIDNVYDLSGRKLSGKPSKNGLYIMNGKKVVVNNK